MDERRRLVITTLDSVALYPAFLVAAIYVFNLVLSNVDYNYIDEIFHVTQCQKYCRHIFDDWDPKITTPPGLYYLGYAYTQLVQFVDPSQSCGLAQLRSLNYVAGVWILPAVLKFSAYPAEQFPISNLISFPLLAVYYTLFYTDVWSTVLVIFSLVAGLGDWYILSSVLGLISIGFRQTNVVWNGLVLVFIIDSKINHTGSLNDIGSFIKSLLHRWSVTVPFVVNACAFIAFLVYNKGITFGDKENHVAGVHLAQLLYCATFLTAFSAPIWVSMSFISRYLNASFGSFYKTVKTLIACLVIAVIIDKFTITHPFLLADNRHYIFYIWKRIIDRSIYSRYYLVPVYHLSLYTVLSLSQGHKGRYSFSWISLSAFYACVIITVVPSPLFEPRYYIVPFIIWRIMIQPVDDPLLPVTLLKEYNYYIRLVLEFVFFNAVNAVVFYVFITYTFEWPQEPGLIQRIIW